MTYGDIQLATLSEERNYYVYVWYFVDDMKAKPFYVGIGKTKRRWKDKNVRSKAFKKFLETHDCASEIVVDGLAYVVAREVENRLKNGFKEMGFNILDAEDDKKERKRRQAEGIAAMPVVDGKRVSGKTGRPTGRPLGEYPDFQKFLEKQKSGLVTVNEACKSMGISKSQWYNLSRKIDRRPRSKGSGDLDENTPEAC